MKTDRLYFKPFKHNNVLKFKHINNKLYSIPLFYDIGFTHNKDVTLLTQLPVVKGNKINKELYIIFYHYKNNIFKREFDIGFKYSTFDDTNAWKVYDNTNQKWICINDSKEVNVYFWIKLKVPPIKI